MATPNPGEETVVAIVENEGQFLPLLSAGYRLAERKFESTQLVVAVEDEMLLVDWGVDDDDRENLLVAVDLASPEPLDRAKISRLANQLAGALDTGVNFTVLKTPAVQVSVSRSPVVE